MVQTWSPYAVATPIQQYFFDGVSIVLETVALAHAQAKEVLEGTLRMATPNGRESLKYFEAQLGILAEATSAGDKLLKEGLALIAEFPKDPIGATQKATAANVEWGRKAMELASRAMKSFDDLLGDRRSPGSPSPLR